MRYGRSNYSQNNRKLSSIAARLPTWSANRNFLTVCYARSVIVWYNTGSTADVYVLRSWNYIILQKVTMLLNNFTKYYVSPALRWAIKKNVEIFKYFNLATSFLFTLKYYPDFSERNNFIKEFIQFIYICIYFFFLFICTYNFLYIYKMNEYIYIK